MFLVHKNEKQSDKQILRNTTLKSCIISVEFLGSNTCLSSRDKTEKCLYSGLLDNGRAPIMDDSRLVFTGD